MPYKFSISEPVLVSKTDFQIGVLHTPTVITIAVDQDWSVEELTRDGVSSSICIFLGLEMP